jgi:hypothetical protein
MVAACRSGTGGVALPIRPQTRFRPKGAAARARFDHDRQPFGEGGDGSTKRRCRSTSARDAPQPSTAADRWSRESEAKETEMREHSGAEGKNNNRNPTLRDAEREKGRSGEAVHGEKLKREGSKRVGTTGTD